MWQRWQWDWLFDDWEAARRRTLTRRFGASQWWTLRWQWRIGQAAKCVALLLVPLLALSFAAPKADRTLLRGLLAWSVFQVGLLGAHTMLGYRHLASFSWSFHHRRPMLLTGPPARSDLKSKALLAAAFTLVALLCLAALG